MQTVERQKQILAYLNEKKTASVTQLSSLFYASAATIRRDLDALQRQGLIQRTHGGAMLFEGGELSVAMRQSQNTAAKAVIGELASYYVKESYTLFLDSSSTVCALVPHLSIYKQVAVVTNGLHCALLLSQSTDCAVYLPPGRLTARSNALSGIDTLDYITGLTADVAMISCSGLTAALEVTEPSLEQSRIKMAMTARAKTKLLLCDSTKFGRSYFSRSSTAADFDAIITDQKPPDDYLEAAHRMGCEMVYPE